MSQYTGGLPVEDVHRWKAEATQRFLGYTIGLDEDAWREPTLLPGWTRAHLATHLARNADYFTAVIDAVESGRPQPAALGRTRRRIEVERGADRHALELQIDLDTSAGALQGAIERVTDWNPPIRLYGQAWPLGILPLARLHEVCVHSLDLSYGLEPDSLHPAAAGWLLRWALDRLQTRVLPALQLSAESLTARLGSGSEPLFVSGRDADLWAWLCGRTGPEQVEGAGTLRLPLFG